MLYSHYPHVRFSRKSEPLELQVCSVIKTQNLTPSLLRYVSIRRYTGCHKNRRCSLLTKYRKCYKIASTRTTLNYAWLVCFVNCLSSQKNLGEKSWLLSKNDRKQYGWFWITNHATQAYRIMLFFCRNVAHVVDLQLRLSRLALTFVKQVVVLFNKF